MIGKLRESIDLANKRILVINLEFVELLCYDFGVKKENVWFVTDCKEKETVAKLPRYSGVNVVLGDYLTWSTNMKFDVIVGNPPYNGPRKKSNGDCIWPEFVKKSLSLLNNDGNLCYVHPSAWRKIKSNLWELITQNQLQYLEIHGLRDGQKTFSCLTRYDWYVLKKSPYTTPTTIRDEEGKVISIDLRKLSWIPNDNLELIDSITAKDSDSLCEVIYDYSYGVNIPKEWMSKAENSNFKYPVIHSISKNKLPKCYYSSVNNRGHFGISKVIINDGGNIYPINDYKGEYGMTQHCFGIVVSSKKEGDLIVAAISTPKFKKVAEATKCSGYYVDYKVFQSFKRDFWKQFVDSEGKELK
jgi:hypothetical protein